MTRAVARQSDSEIPTRERPWAGRAGAFVAGAFPVLAFPQPSIWPAAYIGLVPLLLVVRGAPSSREGAIRAWLGGTGLLLATHHWLWPKVTVFLPLLALFLGALWLPWGWAARVLLGPPMTGLRAAAGVAVLAGGWVLIEVIRAWEYLGGPFGLLGSSQWNNIPMLSAAALGGVWLVGYIAAGVNVAIVAGLAAQDGRARWTAIGIAVLLAGIGPVYNMVAPGPEGAGTARIAVVQPGITSGPQARFDTAESLSREGVDGEVDLVVWGESSVGFDLGERPDLRTRLTELVAAAAADVLVNVDARSTRGGIYKSSVLIGEAGIDSRYDKMRLVPFGEYIPLRPLFGWLTGFTEAARQDRSRGRSPALFSSSGFDYGPLVCFESAFPDMTRTLARMGAEMIVVQSATTTFQESWAPETHAGLAAVRAVETGRPVLHATLTGVSAAFDARGERHLWLGTDDTGTQIVELPTVTRSTPYLVLGDWVVYLSLATVVAAGLVGRRRRRLR